MKKKTIVILLIAALVLVLGAVGAGLAVQLGWVAAPEAEPASGDDVTMTENGLELTGSVDMENDYTEASGEFAIKTVDEVISDGLVTLGEVFSVNARERDMTRTETEHLAVIGEGDGTSGEFRFTNNEFLLEDIPVLEVYDDNGEEKPLLLFLHGITQNKEKMTVTLEDFAAAGYYTVTLDAYAQGSRCMEGVLVDDWASMMITIDDITEVIDYYRTVDGVDAENFILGGFSMGSIEAWFYTLVGEYRPRALVALAGMCDIGAWHDETLETLYYAWLECRRGNVEVVTRRQTESYTEQKKSLIDAMNISAQPEAFSDLPIFFAIGTEDSYFDAERCEAILQTLRDAGNDEVTCIVYDAVEHTITDEMRADALAFLADLAE